MIVITIHTGEEDKNYNVPELSDLTLGDLIEYTETVGRQEPQALKDLHDCHEPERAERIEKNFRDHRLKKERYERLKRQYVDDIKKKQEQVAEKYGGWQGVADIQLNWAFKNLKYFMRDDEGKPITDFYLSGLPTQTNNPKEATIWQLMQYIEKLMGRWAPEEVPFDQFVIDNEVYHLPKEGFSRNTFGEYIETQTVKFEYRKVEGGDMKALPKVIAILCKKKGEVLPADSLERDKWIEERAEVMQKLTAEKALQLAFFFASRSAFSAGVFRLSQARAKDRKQGKGSLRNMAGTAK